MEVVGNDVVRLHLDDWEQVLGETGQVPDSVAALPGMQQAVNAARRPGVKVSIEVAGRDSKGLHFAAADTEMVALMLQVDGPTYQLMAVPPTFFAGSLARLVHLGAARSSGGAAHERASEADVTALFADEQDTRSAALSGFGARLAWTIAVGTVDGSWGMTGIQDSSGHKLLETSGHASGVFTPVSASAIWRMFSSLLYAAGSGNLARRDMASAG